MNRNTLDGRYVSLNQDWQRKHDPTRISAPVAQLLADQRLALGEQALDTLLTESMLAGVKCDLGELDLALAFSDHALAGLAGARGPADTQTLLARLVRSKILRERAR
ncbi:MAG: hypothetical protein ABJA83_08695 [Burkholderiaceae bacterium]